MTDAVSVISTIINIIVIMIVILVVYKGMSPKVKVGKIKEVFAEELKDLSHDMLMNNEEFKHSTIQQLRDVKELVNELKYKQEKY